MADSGLERLFAVDLCAWPHALASRCLAVDTWLQACNILCVQLGYLSLEEIDGYRSVWEFRTWRDLYIRSESRLQI
jgi:hypothetical protein